MKQIDDAYARFTTDEVCDRLERHQVPFAKINLREDVIDDPQVRAMEALVEFEHPVGGAMRQPRPPGVSAIHPLASSATRRAWENTRMSC